MNARYAAGNERETLKTPKTEDRLPEQPWKMKLPKPEQPWKMKLPEPTPPAGTHAPRGFRIFLNPRLPPEPTPPAGTHAARGFRLGRNPRPVPEPTPGVGSGCAGTHAPCRNPSRAWVPALPMWVPWRPRNPHMLRVSFSRVYYAPACWQTVRGS